ncbi:MAG: hypothetical protein GY953_13600, partial [bacterium]|nr:hypothetical protein [bacterium]
MCGRWLLIAAVFCLPLRSQTGDVPEVERARQELERVRTLVSAGAVPRKALADAEQKLVEAQDWSVLRRTLYGSLTVEELTGEQTAAMLEAARRLVERQEREWERAKALAAEGAIPRADLRIYSEELADLRETLELAGWRAELFRELEEMVRAEQELELALEESPDKASQLAVRFDGGGGFSRSQLGVIQRAYATQFGKPLPISANGATARHRSLGFDHRGRVDVAVHP